MQAADLISTRAVVGRPEERLADVADRMQTCGAHHCVVVERETGRLLGLVRLAEVAARTGATQRLLVDLVSPVMPLQVLIDDPAEAVAKLFATHRIYEAAVLTRGNQFHGLITAESAFAWMQTQEEAVRRELEVLVGERQRLNLVLERKVEQRTADLRAALEKVQKTSLTLSHDVRAPLRSIKQLAEMLSVGNEPGLTEQGANCARRIQRIADRIERMAQEIIDEAQRTVGTALPQTDAVDLNEIFEDAITFHRQLLNQSGAAVTKRGELHVVSGRYVPLLQVLANLLANAVNYAAEGRQPMVEVWSEAAGGNVVLCVQDNGRGIARHDTPSIFEPFVRVGSRERRGSGLGLTIVKNAVTELGGAIAVESEEGAGSLFVVTLQQHPPVA